MSAWVAWAIGAVAFLAAAGSFAEVALETARLWRFRPGEPTGRPVGTVPYLIFGFRSPVITVPPSPSRGSVAKLAGA